MSNRVECLLPVRHFSTAFHQESENDELELYLRPIVLFLRHTGIQLPQSGRNRLFFRLANVIFFAADVCMCVIVIKKILSHYWDRAEATTMTISWALLISFTNEILFKLSGHLSLIVKAAGPEPSRLWKTIQQLSFPGLKIRQFTKSVLVVYLLEYFFSIALVILTSYGNLASIPSILTFALYQSFFLFSMNTVLLYLIVGLLAIELFRQMRIEVEDVAAAISHQSIDRAEFGLLNKWKLRYVLLTQLIDRINQCFGLVLLQSITYFYVSIVNSAFYVFISLTYGNYVSTGNYLYNIGKHVFYLLAITFLPHKIKSEAHNIVKALRQFNFNESKLQFKVNFLMIDILESLPKISAYGLFEVNLEMLPKILGTMLTHLIILCQFQMTEKV